MRRAGHTLVELITVVMILAVLACIAVPRLNLAATTGVTADAVARRIITDLRRVRADAILHAARHPKGFALVMSGGEPYRGYQTIDLGNGAAVSTVEIPAGIRCEGGRRFEFGPLGNLRTGSDAELRVATDARVYTIHIVRTTGAVRWTRP